MAGRAGSHETISYSDASIKLEIEVDSLGVARLTSLAAALRSAVEDADQAPAPPGHAARGIPLVDVILAGEGRAWSGSRYCESVAGRRMRYLGHERVRLAEAAPAGAPGGWLARRAPPPVAVPARPAVF